MIYVTRSCIQNLLVLLTGKFLLANCTYDPCAFCLNMLMLMGSKTVTGNLVEMLNLLMAKMRVKMVSLQDDQYVGIRLYASRRAAEDCYRSQIS